MTIWRAVAIVSADTTGRVIMGRVVTMRRVVRRWARSEKLEIVSVLLMMSTWVQVFMSIHDCFGV